MMKLAGALHGVVWREVGLKGKGIWSLFKRCLCWEIVWIRGQVDIPFQNGSGHDHGWHQGVYGLCGMLAHSHNLQFLNVNSEPVHHKFGTAYQVLHQSRKSPGINIC